MMDVLHGAYILMYFMFVRANQGNNCVINSKLEKLFSFLCGEESEVMDTASWLVGISQ